MPLTGWWLFVILLGLAGLALLSWSVRALDAAGAIAAFLVGLFVALKGGIGWLVLMTLFTVVGVIVTSVGHRAKKERGLAEANDGERSWQNVVANGGAPALAVAATWIVPVEVAAMAFAAAVAASTADTMASELGCLSRRARCIVPPFAKMAPGTNGAVSRLGQSAAAVGAIGIGLAAVPLVGLPLHLVWVPALAGFVGCQVDSVLGATLERDHLHDRPLSKQDVNFLASALPALVVLVALA